MVWASNHFVFPNSVFVELRIWRWYHCADTHLHNTIFHLWGVYGEGAAFTVVVSSLCSISYHCHSTVLFACYALRLRVNISVKLENDIKWEVQWYSVQYYFS